MKSPQPIKRLSHRVALVLAVSLALAVGTGGLYAFGMAYYDVDYSWFNEQAREAKQYVLEDAGQLEAFANLVNGTADFDSDGTPDMQDDFEGATVTLRYDIHFTARNIYYAYSLTPIGTADHPFQGTFDGGNRSINRLLLTNTDADGANVPTSYVGLFGHVGEHGQVRNVNLKDTCAIRLKVADANTTAKYIGAVAGWCEGSISGCTAATDIQVVWDDGNAGADRPAENATVIDGVGGIAGYCDGDLADSTFKGNLEVTTTADAYYVKGDNLHVVDVAKRIGGVVGRAGGDPARAGVASRTYGAVRNCANTASLNVVTSGTGGKDNFDEEVDAKSQYVGGIAGYAVGDVASCKNTGAITATSFVTDYAQSDTANDAGLFEADGGGDSVGGIVGGYRSEGRGQAFATEADRERSKAFEDIAGNGVDRGIAGMQEGNGTDTITLSDCTNLGSVVACSNVGGIVGLAGSFTHVTRCINGDPKKALSDASCARVYSTRWNKPRTGGIAGASYGDLSYCRNHGNIANTKIGYYVGGIVGELTFFRSPYDGKYQTPELWGCYNTGPCMTGIYRHGTIAGGNGGYIHDCLYLYGLTGAEDDAEQEQVAVGYENSTDLPIHANLSVAYASEFAAKLARERGDDDAFSLKSAEAVAWLNANCQREGWKTYWMLAANVNRGYPVLDGEGHESVASLDLTALEPQAALLGNAEYTASMNPVPKVKVTVTVGGSQRELVQNADFRVVPDPSALGPDGVCKGTTPGERPYTATIEGIGNYHGTCCEVEYGIGKGNFAECSVYAPTLRYTGQVQNPRDDDIMVVDASGRVVSHDEYTWSVNGGEDCIDPKTYTVSATAGDDGNYRGNCTGKYIIERINIAKDCDVVGFTYTDPATKATRVWFYDDNATKPYEVKPILDEDGKLTYYTLEELQNMKQAGNWYLEDESILEGYVGYPRVEGFRIYASSSATGSRPLSAASPLHRNYDGSTAYGMDADYIATDIKPQVIGVNCWLGRMNGDWWRTIWGGGSTGATVTTQNGIAADGMRNVESWVTGSITVAYGNKLGQNRFTQGYSVATFTINPVQLTPDDLDILQTTTVLKYNKGRAPEDAPTVTMKYLGNVVDTSNYTFTIDHVVTSAGVTLTGDAMTYNVGDALYYRLHFVDGGSIQCDDIELHATIVEGQKPIDDPSIKVVFDPDFNNVYTFDGIKDPEFTVVDTEKGTTLRPEVDYTFKFWANDHATPASTSGYSRTDTAFPNVLIQGSDGYSGSRREYYTVERTVLHKGDLEAIGRGEVANARLCPRGTFTLSNLDYYDLCFPYRACGFDVDELSERCGLAWQPADWSNSIVKLCTDDPSPSARRLGDSENMFEVVRIQDESGADVARAIEPGSYTITVHGTPWGSRYFVFPEDEYVTLPLRIEPLPLSRTTTDWGFVGTDGKTHVWLQDTGGVYPMHFYGDDTGWAIEPMDESIYTGREVQPFIPIFDGRFYRIKSQIMNDAANGGMQWRDYLLPRSEYDVTTVGYEHCSGPVEPGTYYADKVMARNDSRHVQGKIILDGEIRPRNGSREWFIVAANLSDFQVADAQTDISEGNWIRVADAFWGNEGATPGVQFFVNGQECAYVEGEDYRLDYSGGQDVGEGAVRITVLDEGHLTANSSDSEGRSYVEVPFQVVGDKVNLADTAQVTWTLPESVAIADEDKGTLVDAPSTARFENSSGAIVTVPQAAYTIETGVLDESAGVFMAKDSGWQEGDTVWLQVKATGAYPQFTAVPTGKLSMAATGGKGLMAAPLPAGVLGQMSVQSGESQGGHTVIGSAPASLGESFATANQEGSLLSAVLESKVITYDGTDAFPEVTVTRDGQPLAKGVDYLLVRSSGTGAGDATVTVRGIGRYRGSCDLPFTVVPRNLENCTVQIDPMAYTGDTLRPPKDSIRVFADGNELPADDFTVESYAENSVEAGQGAGSLVLASASGNLTGQLACPFDITGMRFAPERFSVAVEDQAFTGANITLKAEDIVVRDTKRDVELTFGTDFVVSYVGDHRSVGTAGIVVSGKGNYAGTLESSFKIVGSDLSGAMVEVLGGEGGSFAYTGQQVKPDVRVTLGANELSPDDDYSVRYASNTNVGTARITVTGKGNTTGTAQATFAIDKAVISDATCTVVQRSPQYSWTGAAVAPSVTLRLHGVRMNTMQYRLSYLDAKGAPLASAPTDIGDYLVKVEGVGDNLVGSMVAPFSVVQAPIAECDIVVVRPYYDFGYPVKPSVSLTTSAGVAVDASEYRLRYYDVTDLGAEGTLDVEATDNHFTGRTAVDFRVERIPLSADNVVFPGDNARGGYEWTGGIVKPEPTIIIGERKLKRGTDYDIAYLGDCTSIGTQAVEITCPDTSAFTSNVTARYEIVKKKQVISVARSVQKETGAASFALGAKTNGSGKLTYRSSNPLVAAVDASGAVKVGQAGSAVITVSCGATDTCEEADDVQVRVTVSAKQVASPAKPAESPAKQVSPPSGSSVKSPAKQAANPLKLKAKKASVKFAKVKKRKVVLKRSKVLTVKNAKGKLTFSKVKKGSSKFLSVNKNTGNVTVAKKTKRGTYKLKVKVKAAGTSSYKSATKTATVKVVVK